MTRSGKSGTYALWNTTLSQNFEFHLSVSSITNISPILSSSMCAALLFGFNSLICELFMYVFDPVIAIPSKSYATFLPILLYPWVLYSSLWSKHASLALSNRSSGGCLHIYSSVSSLRNGAFQCFPNYFSVLVFHINFTIS